jgi:hypothetical protein
MSKIIVRSTNKQQPIESPKDFPKILQPNQIPILTVPEFPGYPVRDGDAHLPISISIWGGGGEGGWQSYTIHGERAPCEAHDEQIHTSHTRDVLPKSIIHTPTRPEESYMNSSELPMISCSWAVSKAGLDCARP